MEQTRSGLGGSVSFPEVPSSQPLRGYKFDSAFHTSEVDQMSTMSSRGFID